MRVLEELQQHVVDLKHEIRRVERLGRELTHACGTPRRPTGPDFAQRSDLMSSSIAGSTSSNDSIWRKFRKSTIIFAFVSRAMRARSTHTTSTIHAKNRRSPVTSRNRNQ